MNSRLLQQIIVVTLIILFVVGCDFYTVKETSVQITPVPAFVPSPSSKEWEVGDHLKESLMKWQGERVILLDGGEDDYIGISPSVTLENEKLWIYHAGDPKQGLPAQEYAGRTGVITDVEIGKGLKLTITLDDSGEQIVAEDVYGIKFELVTSNLGFLSEMETIQSYVGQPVWALGPKKLQKKCNGTEQQDVVDIATFQKLTVIDAEWGYFDANHQSPIFLYLKTEQGEEGCLVPFTSFDSRFHLEISDFYLENPVTLFPDWDEDTWEMISAGPIAVGMTEGMVTAVCGNSVVCSIPSSSDKVLYVCECDGSRFSIEDGRVTGFVE